ncbi:alpha/beta fold hydrolase [Rhodococcus zopfii]|uniref:alpha/beta fold hydrolase n=1 Tax=Rhodococcus zopfii TaxID=43772 RepID=UPI0035285173
MTGAGIVGVRSVDGTRLHTEIHGPDDAPTIVLAHGILCSTLFWRNQIRDLSEDFRVVAYDHRGHGRSAAPRAGSYELDHLADDLQAVLAATVPDGQRAVVAGHSMGGIAVMSWAQKYRADTTTRVSAVALVNTTPGDILDHVRFLRGPERTLALRRRLAQLVVPAARVPLPRRLPLRRQLLAHVAVGAAADPSIGHEVDAILAATSARGRGGYGALLVNMRADIDPAHVPVPAVVIAGRHDRIAPPARSQAIATRLQHPLGLHELDSGHCGPLERPDEVTAVLRNLLEENR